MDSVSKRSSTKSYWYISNNRDLIESNQAGVKDRGEGNVTALHWASINNHLAVAQYLLDKGAEIDAIGGL